ncbi:MAG: DUF2461 domain-containing protein [Myxococcales bacterium]|nr:DUF2461 domain-containing protein [Myxococcales bacterium]
MSAARFTGFPAETFAFLGALARHNDRDWFEAHRDEYDEACVAPALAFVAAVGPRVKALGPGIRFEAALGGSLLRIHRDLRFVRDAKPYKDYLDVWFWRGENKGRDAPSFGMRLHADRLVVGAGIRQLEGERLALFREAVHDERRGRRLTAMLKALCARGRYELAGKQLTRVPAAFDAEHPRADLLRRTGLFVCRDGPVPRSASTARFADECMEHFATMAPVCKWLAAVE